MDLSGHESEIPIPISSSYVGVHGHGHPIIPDSPPPPHSLHHSSSNGPRAPPPPAPTEEQQHNMVVVPYSQAKKGVVVRYRECLKNHAASIGGSATDGCGEFMPSGEEGSLEALKCSACSCHRNFHRKEVEGESSSSCDCYHHLKNSSRRAAAAAAQAHTRGLLVSAAGPEAFGYPPRGGASLQHHHQLHQMVMPLGALQVSDQSDEMEGTGGGGVRPPLVKKRFRTKFTPEQKEKMLGFAERVGWRLQRQEESVVQQFCQEIGVKRRVLKVWMHNNKHNLAKKSPTPLQLE